MRRLLLSSISLLIALLVAAVGYRAVRAGRPTVMVVDTTSRLKKVILRRQQEVGFPIEVPDLVRVPLDEETARVFFPGNWTKYYEYDPVSYSRPVALAEPGFTRFPEHPAGGFYLSVNSLGLRDEDEVSAEKHGLRVLVLGDSHTHGLCANEESFASVAEELIAEVLPGPRVEVLNAGGGYYHFYNYLGTFERLRYLDPDLLVMVAYGGNDFSSTMLLQRYFHARSMHAQGPRYPRLPPGLGAQEMSQCMYFLHNPEDEPLAVQTALSITAEIERQCREQGTELLVVYLPPPLRGQPLLYADLVETTLDRLDWEPAALEVSDRLADAWLVALRERGIRTLDLRPDFGAAKERLYWESDLHLNVAGHRFVAQRLLGELAPLLAGR